MRLRPRLGFALRRTPAALALLLTLAATGACTHVPSELSAERGGGSDERPRSKALVLALETCTKLDALRHFENGLFRSGFVREVVREEDPVPFEIVDRLMSGQAKLIMFRKSDFESLKTRGSLPYHEIVNRYGLAACEEPAGGLYLIVVRHDPVAGDKFLGDRFEQALKQSECKVTPVAKPRDLGLYADTTEDDLVRHVRRGQCQAYAKEH